ncbi:hypothetical protein PV08_02389 [Exophiala spinifera]|uniref:RRM domain-containing protein n=1 Tax=Exophiala spinifera TaxID=91928 RepID=A0A0D1ZZH3_9EURO|nr:uncharacterized protein PV08_02389 [Exophiala spinifera]KIW18102.1 hypothetical protein PV08_02389 [Exophiala spinifera]
MPPPNGRSAGHYDFGPSVDAARRNRRLAHLGDLSFRHSPAQIEEALKRLLPADITPTSFHWAPYPPANPGNRPHRGWCFVMFATRPDLSRAVAAWNKKKIFGRVVKAHQADRGYRPAPTAMAPTTSNTSAFTAQTPAVATPTVSGPLATTATPPNPAASMVPASAAPTAAMADDDHTQNDDDLDWGGDVGTDY